MIKSYYNLSQKALIYSNKAATPEFWDNHWETENFNKTIKCKNQFLNKITAKYLAPGSRILEGGCGLGRNVYSLQHIGFDAYGIDFAVQTIALINRYAPELKISEGDVRNLPFDNNFFDGYWSLGVIEHFYNGYEDIVIEMGRVIRPQGFLFLTFPHMHLLRKLKARLGLYPILPQNFNPKQNNFYQFALDTDKVINQFRTYGFQLKYHQQMAGLKGLKDEVDFLKPLLQKTYDSKTFVSKVINQLLDMILKRWCGHSILLIFQKY